MQCFNNERGLKWGVLCVPIALSLFVCSLVSGTGTERSAAATACPSCARGLLHVEGPLPKYLLCPSIELFSVQIRKNLRTAFRGLYKDVFKLIFEWIYATQFKILASHKKGGYFVFLLGRGKLQPVFYFLKLLFTSIYLIFNFVPILLFPQVNRAYGKQTNYSEHILA